MKHFSRDSTDKRIRRDSFTGVAELEVHVAYHNLDPKPFILKAKATDILAKGRAPRPLWRPPDQGSDFTRTALVECA